MAASRNDVTVLLSRSTPVILKGRNPGHAGGGLPAAAVRPVLPPLVAPPPSACSSNARSDAFQPGLRASTRRARSSSSRGCSGRYSRASTSATVSDSGPDATLMMASPAST